MGCDIHCYIQHKPYKDSDYVSGFGGRINPGRNYVLFGLMAGVRYDCDSYIEPRGIPDQVSWEAWADYAYTIDDNYKEDRYVTKETAKRWAGYAGTKLYSGYGPSHVTTNFDEAKYVSGPDWHSHSWMTAEEFENVLLTYSNMVCHYDNGPYKIPDSYAAILAAMKSLGPTAQLVFWFDN